ncbi:MAG: GntR family transcriptional regulator [Bacillota bacterium]
MNQQEKMPKYLQIKKALLDNLRTGVYPVGGVIPSETELMQQFGASRFTVRQALAELVTEGWLRRERGRGTFFTPSRPKNSSKDKTIAFLSPSISTYIFPEIIRGIDIIAQETEYHLILAHSNHHFRQEERALQRFKEIGVRGIIVEPSMSALPNPNLGLFLELLAEGIAMVFLDSILPEVEAPAVVVMDEEGGYKATKYLLELGHRRIGIVYKETHQPAVNRYRGYERALKEAGLPIEPLLVRKFRGPESRTPAGYLQTKELLALGPRRPTAIFYYNDETAVDSYRAIWEAGLSIPKDISIIGFDDSTLAQLPQVGLTSMTHPKQEAGRLAAHLLFSQIDGTLPTERRLYTFHPELIIRNSCQPLVNDIPSTL